MNRKQRIAQNEISEVCEVTLGGYPQKIMLEGQRSNPVVLFLHGGPGFPIPFCVGSRGLFPEITRQLTLVCWDQYGCGANNHPVDDSFTIESFVDMTVDLIRELRRRFPENRLILFGTSWGSILALKAAEKCGDQIDGAVTYGQVLCEMTFCGEAYAALEASRMPKRKKELLRRIQNERTVENARKIMMWIRRYTEGYQCKDGEKLPISGAVLGMLTSPDYRLRDFLAVMVNGYLKNRSLTEALIELDLREELAHVRVPYTVIQGSGDLVTSTEALREFTARTENPFVRLIVVEKNGHMPDKRAMDIVIKELLRAGSKVT